MGHSSGFACRSSRGAPLCGPVESAILASQKMQDARTGGHGINKQDLIRTIARDAEVTQRQAAVMVESTINAIIDAVTAGDKVQLLGFGTFEARFRQARTGHLPVTNEPLEIPASTVPVFKAGVEFREAVSKNR